MKRGIRRVPALWRASRLLRRWYHARSDAYPDWPAILASEPERWENARRSAAGGPRVLMATSIGSYAHAITLESALAAALTFRGAEVHTLLCDAALPACAECEASLYPNLARFARQGPQSDLCRDCLWPAERVYRSLGITVHRYSDWLFPDDKAQAREIAASLPFAAIQGYERDGIAIGEHAYAGALRFFASGSLDDEPQGEAVLRRYLESALLTATATTRLLRGVGFTSTVFTHGIYVPWGLVGAVARREGVRVATWNVAYRKRRFIFSHDDTYHHTLMTEPRAHWESLVLTETQERELMQYLASQKPNSLWPDNARSRADIARWQSWSLAHWSKEGCEPLIFNRLVKKILNLGSPDEAAVAQGTQCFNKEAAVLDAHLAKQPYLAGKELTLADFSVAAPLFYAKEAELPIGPHARVQEWFGRVSALPCWRETAPQFAAAAA